MCYKYRGAYTRACISIRGVFTRACVRVRDQICVGVWVRVMATGPRIMRQSGANVRVSLASKRLRRVRLAVCARASTRTRMCVIKYVWTRGGGGK